MGSSLLLIACLLLCVLMTEIIAATKTTVFTLKNNCKYTIWPGTLSGNGVALLGNGGFELVPQGNLSFSAPPGWSGRFWARTDCSLPSKTGGAICATGDCGGALECTLGGATPVTLAEFTLAFRANDKDFYDVSLVDGYNVGIGITAVGTVPKGSSCGYAGCVSDVNARCPEKLKVKSDSTGDNNMTTIACKSACDAFQTEEYCCTGAHALPNTCGPTKYSKIFKNACPTAYSYAYDDPTSTFTCQAGTKYLITFCPSFATARAAHFVPKQSGRAHH